MKCKDVRAWIDDQEHTSEDAYGEHIHNCKTCKAYQEEQKLLEQELSELFNRKDVNKKLNKAILKEVPNKRINIITIAATIILSVVLFTNPNFIAIAEKIPFVGDIIDFFERDEIVELAVEQGLPVQDHNVVVDEYKLLVKDMYIDKYNLKMQFTVADQNNEVPTDVLIQVEVPQLLNYPREFMITGDEHWFKLDEKLNIDYIVAEKMGYTNVDVLIKVLENGEVLIEESIELDTSHLKASNYTKYEIDDVIELDFGVLEFDTLNVGILDMALRYKAPHLKNATFIGYFFEITDDLGNSYGSNSYHWRYNDPYMSAGFSNLIFDGQAESLEINLKSIGYQKIDFLTNELNVEQLLEFEGTQFVYHTTNSNDNLKIVLIPEVPIRRTDYPELMSKSNLIWSSIRDWNQPSSMAEVTVEDYEAVFGSVKDVQDVGSLQPLIEYYKEKYDVTLDVQSLSDRVQQLMIQKSIHVIKADLVEQMEYIVYSDPYVEPEKVIIGYVNGRERIDVNKSFTVELTQ